MNKRSVMLERQTVSGKKKAALVLCALLFLLVALQIYKTPLASAASVENIHANSDTYVNSANADTNYGASTTLTTKMLGSTVCRALVKFDISSIPTEATILSATLKLTVSSAGAGVTISVYRVTTNWLESEATWNNATSSTAWTNPGGDYTGAAHDYTTSATVGEVAVWDVTDIVKYWHQNGGNYGFILKVGEAVNESTIFYSREDGSPANRPVLEIEYALWYAAETWDGTVGTSASWQAVETWAGSISALSLGWSFVEGWAETIIALTPPSWHFVESWAGTIMSSVEWEIVDTWGSVVSAIVAWNSVDNWTGVLQASLERGWMDVDVWNGTIDVVASAWDAVESWTGVITTSAGWDTVETLVGNINTTVNWQSVEEWTCAINSTVNWYTADVWSGAVSTVISAWSAIETWTALIHALDDDNPVIDSFVINGGDSSTTSSVVSLSIVASDKSTGVYQMCFKNEDGPWSPWEPYSTTKIWALSIGDGLKTVYAKIRDYANNESAVVSDNIIKITQPLSPPSPPPTRNPDFTISLSSSNVTIARGESANIIITVSSVDGYNLTVSLSSNNIKDIITNISPEKVIPTSTATITIKIGARAAAGTRTLTITGIGSDGKTHSASCILTVTEQPTMYPYSYVNDIVPYSNTPPITITATAIDNNGSISSVKLYYRYSNDNVNWSNWLLFYEDNDYADNWSWSFTAPNGGGYYEFYSLATDNDGEVEKNKQYAEAICRLNLPQPNTITIPFKNCDMITRLEVTTWGDTADAYVTMSTFDAQTNKPRGAVYDNFAYILINSENAITAKIVFRVPKVLFDEKNISVSSITLAVLDGGRWNTVQTTFEGFEDNYFYYSAVVAPMNVVCTIISTDELIPPPTYETSLLYFIAIAVSALAMFVVVSHLRRNKKLDVLEILEEVLKKKYSHRLKPYRGSMYKAISNKIYSLSNARLKNKVKNIFPNENVSHVEVVPLKNAIHILNALTTSRRGSDSVRAVANQRSYELLKKGVMVLLVVNGDIRLVRTLSLFDARLDRKIEEVMSKYTLPSTKNMVKEIIEESKKIRKKDLAAQAAPEQLNLGSQVTEEEQKKVFDIIFGNKGAEKLVLEMSFSTAEDKQNTIQSTLRVQQAGRNMIRAFEDKEYLSISAYHVNEDFFSGNLTDDKLFVFAKLAAPSGCIYIDKTSDKYISCFFSNDRQELETINSLLSSNLPIIFTPIEIAESVCKKYCLLIPSRKLVEGFFSLYFKLIHSVSPQEKQPTGQEISSQRVVYQQVQGQKKDETDVNYIY